MTSFLAARSIPLGETTRAAVKENGGNFVSRDRSVEDIVATLPVWRLRYDWFWNMGHSELNLDEEAMTIFNQGETVVKPLLTPQSTRELLGDLMPPQTGEDEFIWLKDKGRGGRNKQKLETRSVSSLEAFPYWEDHIEGQEYRVITVGRKRVQQFKREGDNANRRYIWVSMQSLPRLAKRIVREASSRLPDRSIVAWDLVLREGHSEHADPEAPLNGSTGASMESQQTSDPPRGECYLLEGNTSPGLNGYTVSRIVRAVEEAINAS